MSVPARGPRPRVEVVEYSPRLAGALAEFVRKVWDPSATAESVTAGRARVAATNPGCVDGRIPTVLLTYDDHVVGHLTSIPERLRIGGREVPVAWTAGFHVLPEHRNGPVGVMVAKEMARVQPASMCTTVLDGPLRIFTAMGWKHVGTVPNQLFVVDGAAVAGRLDLATIGLKGRLLGLARAAQRLGLASLGGAVAGLLIRARAATAPRARGLALSACDAAEWVGIADADGAWARAAAGVTAGLVRDAARIRWRFASQPGRYLVVEARERGTLLGWAILKRPTGASDDRLRGMRIAPIVDLLFPPERLDVAAALIDGAIAVVRRERLAHAVIASTPHRATRECLRRAGFVTNGGNLHLVVHPSLLPDPAPAFEEWWHARGDGDADQSF